ncbi:MAG: hypothetical protein ABL994_20240, partial [Verrucomicrobiales bacterium]
MFSVAFTPDGHQGISSDLDGVIHLWDTMPSRETEAFLSKNVDDPFHWPKSDTSGAVSILGNISQNPIKISISADGRIARASSKFWDGKSQFRDLATGYLLNTPDSSPSLIKELDLLFVPWEAVPGLRNHVTLNSGRHAIGIKGLSSVEIMEIETGTTVRSFGKFKEKVNCVAVSPDEKTLFVGGSDNLVTIWEVETGDQIGTLKGHSDSVNAIAISPDGDFAISGGGDDPLNRGKADATLKIWDLSSRRELRTLHGHAAPLSDIIFSPDGKTAISADAAGMILFWRFSRTLERISLLKQLEAAREALTTNPQDANSLAVLAKWSSFNGAFDVASEYYIRAITAGIRIPHLELARSYWGMGDLRAAEREFTEALAEKEAPTYYLRL